MQKLGSDMAVIKSSASLRAGLEPAGTQCKLRGRGGLLYPCVVQSLDARCL